MGQAIQLGEKKTVTKKIKRYHHYYRRKGGYSFFIKNSIRVAIGLLILIGAILLLRQLAPNIEQQFEALLASFTTTKTLIFFYASESLFGLVPPDLFIIWAQKFSFPYGMVAILALLSYVGGVTSYFMGNYISHIPSVENWIKKKFLDQLMKIRKWGGLMIVFAALFPLPFSPVCMIAGTIRYPLPGFFVLALFRFARFFGYALVLFKVF